MTEDAKPSGGVEIPDQCPHCGTRLSRWEQVLLSVDRALMCRNCWYRIILDAYEEGGVEPHDSNPKEPK